MTRVLCTTCGDVVESPKNSHHYRVCKCGKTFVDDIGEGLARTSLTGLIIDDDNLVGLMYCPRTKHSIDIPLKYSRKNCIFRHEGECVCHPSQIRYCEANDMQGFKKNLTIGFRCVIKEEKT